MAKEKFDFIQPIKDIPALLKGFPKNLKHLIKDPVNTVEEAKGRRKEIYPLLYMSIGLALVFVLVSLIPKVGDIVMLFNIIPIVGLMLSIFLISVAKKIEKKFINLECSNCKTRIAYNGDVSYKVIKRTYNVTKSKTQNARAGIDIKVIGKEAADVEITCKCQECGTIKTFSERFRTAECVKSDNVSLINADLMLANYEKDIRAEQAAGFDGSTGAKITYKHDLDKLVKDYFGNFIQM